MLKVTSLVASIVFGLAVPAAAAGVKGAKISTGLTNPANVAGPFTNGTSKGAFSFKGTKATIKAKGTTVSDTDGVHCTGDEVICLVGVRAALAGGTALDVTVLLMGEASGGKVTASHDLCKERDESVAPETYFFCPGYFGEVAPIAITEVNAVCYAPDATWVAAHAPGIPMSLTGHSCEGLFSPPPMTLPSTVLFSSGSTLLVQ